MSSKDDAGPGQDLGKAELAPMSRIVEMLGELQSEHDRVVSELRGQLAQQEQRWQSIVGQMRPSFSSGHGAHLRVLGQSQEGPDADPVFAVGAQASQISDVTLTSESLMPPPLPGEVSSAWRDADPAEAPCTPTHSDSCGEECSTPKTPKTPKTQPQKLKTEEHTLGTITSSPALSQARKSMANVFRGSAIWSEKEVEVHPRRFRKLHKAVTSPAFEFLWSCLIFMNTLFMAAEAQYDGIQVSYEYALGRPAATAPATEAWPGAAGFFVGVDYFFGILFAIEMCIRLLVLGKEYLMDAWSWIDIVAVMFWFAEKASEEFLPMDPRVIRVVRLMRLMRFLRIIKFINAFEKLYLMVASIKSSMSALSWSAMVLLLVEIIIALLLNFILEGFIVNETNDDEERQLIYEYFGTFSKSLLSMFEMLLGNWYTVTRYLVKVSEWWAVFGVAHQLIFGFAVIEVITGVFLHETFKVASLDDGIMTNETKRAIKAHTSKMTEFFKNADLDGNGFLDQDELEEVLQRKKVQEWLTAMGLDVQDMCTAITLFDKDGDGNISPEEFVETAFQLKGGARAIDLAVIRSMLQKVLDKFGLDSMPVAITQKGGEE